MTKGYFGIFGPTIYEYGVGEKKEWKKRETGLVLWTHHLDQVLIELRFFSW